LIQLFFHTALEDAGRFAAGGGAGAAGFGAGAHFGVVGEFVAVLGAEFADFGAQGADAGVEVRFADHVIGGKLAEFGTVEEEADVGGFGVAVAELEAVLNGVGTVGVAVVALIDTVLNLTEHGTGSELGHEGLLGESHTGPKAGAGAWVIVCPWAGWETRRKGGVEEEGV
jgi:hypothetical protein